MRDILRESAIGQVCRSLFGRKSFPYPEELADFQLPSTYGQAKQKTPLARPETREPRGPSPEDTDLEKADEEELATRPEPDHPLQFMTSQERNLSRHATNHSANQQRNQEIQPMRTKEGITLVTWYTEDDPANPQNWSSGKRVWVASWISIYTFAIYIGSSLYAPAEEDVVRIFGVSEEAASLGLALYVLGYGVGPLLWAPLSEIPVIGRNPVYMLTLIVFVILCIPASLISDYGGFLAIRFFLGFFGSPCLATGGATLGDMYPPNKLPYLCAIWAGGATLGPAIGPVMAGFAVQAKGWRWGSWELMWIAGPVLFVLFISLPETGHDNLLLRRARRLRKLTGRTDLKSESELHQESMTARQVAFDALIKPWEINILDPAVLFTTVYTALVYGIFYSFFESFPMVYPKMYGFNLGESGLPFLAVAVGLFIALAMYCAYFYYHAEPQMLSQPGFGPPESRLLPAIIASFVIPVGLFLFAWTARPSVHWMASIVGVALNQGGLYIILQCMFLYLPFTYPKYSGSLFAANDFARASFAAGAVMFSRPMFINLGVDWGVSLLAFLTIVCIAGVFTLYFYGGKLRARSKFAQH